MNKIVIPIIIAVILLVGIGAYFVFQKPISPDNKPTPQIEKNNSTETPTTQSSKNMIRSIRTVQLADALGGKAGVEIEVWSSKEFPVRNELAVLRIGAQEFTLSRYPESGDTHTLIFTLTPEEFAKTATGDPVTVQYGRGGESNEQWDFGPLDKSLSAKRLSPQGLYGPSSAPEVQDSPRAKSALSLPPQGLYDSCVPSDADCLAHLDKMASAGFRLVVNYGVFDYDVADIISYADHANAVGMKVIWDMSSRPYRDGTFDRDYIRERVNAVKTHPATWGYYVADEPDENEHRQVKALSDYVHDLDPAHPRFLVHYYQSDDPTVLLRPHVDTADVIALDVYTTAAGDKTPEDIGPVAKSGQKLADKNGKKWAIVLQSFDAKPYIDDGRLPKEYSRPGWPSKERMIEERNLALENSHPVFILWFSYHDILQSSDPAGHWADLVNAAFSD